MPTPTTPQSTIDRIQALYRSGTAIKEIESSLDVSRPTVYKYIREMGGHTRYGARPQHSIWHEAFDELTDEAAYWVGLLLTDGCIHRGRRVKLSLQEKDTPTLERLLRFVRSSAKPSKVENGSRGVRFTSKHMCDRLAELGVVPRKTEVARAPDSLMSNRNFWRGVMDGDASVRPGEDGSPGLRLTGYSEAPLLHQWAAVCHSRWGLPTCVRARPDHPTVSDVLIYGAQVMPVLHWLYSGCTPQSPTMERKLEAYRQICTAHGDRTVATKGKYRGRFAHGSRKP